MELLQVEIDIYYLKMHLKVIRYQMSHCYLCFKSKPIMKKSFFELFIVDYIPTLNKKDPVDNQEDIRSLSSLAKQSMLSQFVACLYKLNESYQK